MCFHAGNADQEEFSFRHRHIRWTMIQQKRYGLQRIRVKRLSDNQNQRYRTRIVFSRVVFIDRFTDTYQFNVGVPERIRFSFLLFFLSVSISTFPFIIRQIVVTGFFGFFLYFTSNSSKCCDRMFERWGEGKKEAKFHGDYMRSIGIKQN